MSEREWIVVRDKQGHFFVTAYVTDTRATSLGWYVLARTPNPVYADGFADALNLAAEDRSVLPEWNG